MTDNLMKEQEDLRILEKEDKNNINKNDINKNNINENDINENDINMILSQTNYDKIIAIEKLKIFDNPLDVIKDYLTDGNSNMNNNLNNNDNKSLNQQIYSEIRNKFYVKKNLQY